MSKKRVIIAVLVILAALVAFGEFYILSYGRSLRFARMVLAHSVLKQAYIEYSGHGSVEPNGSSKPFVFTNTVVVDGTPIYPVVAVAVLGFEDEGVLAMTTNETLIWLDKTRPPKIIPTSGYRPHFFPERF
jgi:hypothetical protein